MMTTNGAERGGHRRLAVAFDSRTCGSGCSPTRRASAVSLVRRSEVGSRFSRVCARTTTSTTARSSMNRRRASLLPSSISIFFLVWTTIVSVLQDFGGGGLVPLGGGGRRGGGSIAIVSASSLNENNNNTEEQPKKRRKRRICLLPASFPWGFGPYQSQMYKLSLALKDTYDIFWMTRSEQSTMPFGEYTSWEDIKKYHPDTVDPPPNFEMSHITFLGRGIIPNNDSNNPHGIYGKSAVFATQLNQYASHYQLDGIITLLDLGQLVPDVPFAIPVIGWVPLHCGPHLTMASPDAWTLRSYHGIAGLSPTTTRSARKVAEEGIPVDWIPHIIEREELMDLASKARMYLDGGMTLAEADEVLIAKREGRAPVEWEPPSQEEEESEEQHGRPPVLSTKDEDTFFVLLQGGNYDAQDRKSWDTSLQAYARFFNEYIVPHREAYPDSPIQPHLHIHSIESYIAESENTPTKEAPPPVIPQGVLLPKRIYETGLPRSEYYMDVKIHEVEVVAALKSRANVCLHPSKVEGFGMNVLECQALGTPVITTNHTSTGDFTMYGITVPVKQYQYVPGGIGYEFAMPDVEGIKDALGQMWLDHVTLRQQRKKEEEEVVRQALQSKRVQDMTKASEWIDEEFSSQSVGRKFIKLIEDATSEYGRREMDRQLKLLNNNGLAGAGPGAGAGKGGPPSLKDKPYYAIAPWTDTVEHPDVVDWDIPWTLIAPPDFKVLKPDNIQFFAWALIESERSANACLVIPVRYADTGEEVPILGGDGMPHPDIPILVRTYILTALQNQSSRRKSLVYFAIQHAQSIGEIQRMPEGLAIISSRSKTKKKQKKKKKVGGDAEGGIAEKERDEL